jgi:FkbM family methyltransferase
MLKAVLVWKKQVDLIRFQGLLFTLNEFFRNFTGKDSFRRYRLVFVGFKHWIYAQKGTSDTIIYDQVFVRQEYTCVNVINEIPKSIIDAGANVGYSSAYFRQCFPNVKVVALEPDVRNYGMLLRNVGGLDGVITVLGALWGETCMLSMSNESYRDGSACAQVVSQLKGDVQAFTIDEIIQSYNLQHPILVKIDIEGAESNVFLQQRADTWLEKVDTVVIEIHEDSLFGNPVSDIELAMERHGFSFVTSGELRMYTRAKK